VLPKNLIHHVTPGQGIYDFVESWKAGAASTSAARAWGSRQWFVAAAEKLAGLGYEVDLRHQWLTKGWLIWRKPEL